VSDKPYIYVASSWRNERQHEVVVRLRDEGYGVYDFRHPDGGKGFAWSDLNLQVDYGTGGDRWDHDVSDPNLFVQALNTDGAKEGYRRDFAAMERASIFVLVLPCERDAHLELGWACGAGKETVVLLNNPCKASLMYRMVDHIAVDMDDLVEWLRD
jgi:hypothetical protein